MGSTGGNHNGYHLVVIMAINFKKDKSWEGWWKKGNPHTLLLGM